MNHLAFYLALALVTLLSISVEATVLPPLKVDSAGRFLVQDLGGGEIRPFFWQGDTAWNLHRLQKADIDLYLENRAGKGFNVIQGPVLDWSGLVTGPLKVSNGYGKVAFTGKNTTSPALNADIPGADFNDYFDQTDYIVNKAESLGMYVMLLPFWAQGINDLDDDNTEKAALREIGRKLGLRYKNRSAVIWCVGGEAAGESPDASVRILAEGLEAGHGGANLMGVHPPGNASSASLFHNESWLDFNMIQSGYVTKTNYPLVAADYARSPAKPTFDSEIYYEEAGTPPGVDLDVRKGAYWSVFAGAFGTTTGHQAVWQFWLGNGDPTYGNFKPTVDWKSSLNSEGAGDLIHLRRLMESRPYLSRFPDQSLILSGAGNSSSDHVQATRDGTAAANNATYIMAYSPVANSMTINTSVINSSKLDAWWYDPRTGNATRFLRSAPNTNTLAVSTPASGPDWVLVIDDATRGYTAPSAEPRPRHLVLTDIGGDPDDEQSMVRLMTCVNEFDIEGLVTSSQLGHGQSTEPQLIRDIVTAYGTVRSNLLVHAAGYPTAQFLLDRVKDGHGDEGSIGVGFDSEGSNWIIAAVDKQDPRPLWITIWGGSRELRQALWRVKRDRTPAQVATFVSKIRVHAIADQDGHGAPIRQEFPALFWIDNGAGLDRTNQVFRGQYQTGNTTLQNAAWVNSNIKTNHGALGALYPTNTDQDGMKEGDTPSFAYVRPTGMQDPEQPGWGGWGGRFKPAAGASFIGDKDTLIGFSGANERHTVARWRPAFQRDLQARMDWCKTSNFSGANHHPLPKVGGDASSHIIHLAASAGATVNLSAAGSSDPDGNSLSYEWFHYQEAGTFPGAVPVNGAATAAASFVAPTVVSPQTIHIIVAITDNGTPALTAYRRVIVTIAPSGGGGTGPGAAHWKFDETSGTTAADSSGNNNTATLTNGPVWTPGGKINGALSFDGTNDYAQAAHSASLSLTKDFTIAAWIRPSVVNKIQGIVTKVTDTNDKQYALAISADGKLAFDYEKSGNNYALVAGTLVANQWQHVAVTVSAARVVTLYVNGASVASSTAPAEVAAQSNPLAIGRWGGSYNNNYFAGLLDDVRIYGRTLGPSDIQALSGGSSLQVSAGPDQILTLPAASTLSGTATVNGLPSSGVTSAWTKASGPGSVTFANASMLETSATFTAPGAYVLRLSASDGVTAASDDMALTVNDSLEAWKIRNTISSMTDDDDKDGASALEEYARGTDPKTPDHATAPMSVISGNFLTLSYDRALFATDVTFTVKVSGNLIDWQSITVPFGAPVANGDGTETVTVRDTISTTTSRARFIRLELTAP